MSGHTYTHTRTHTHTHTYTHDNYDNPRCAHAHRGLIILYNTYIGTTIRGISINHFLINNYVKPFCRHHNRNEDFCSLSLLPCITRCKKLL